MFVCVFVFCWCLDTSFAARIVLLIMCVLCVVLLLIVAFLFDCLCLVALHGCLLVLSLLLNSCRFCSRVFLLLCVFNVCLLSCLFCCLSVMRVVCIFCGLLVLLFLLLACLFAV